MQRIISLASVLLLTLFLSGCESSEERAERHYQNALTLMAEGDNDRAIVELRNVFNLNGSHLEARHALAELLLTHNGNVRGSFSQYLRLVEQYPDDLKARIALSKLAFQTANWDEFTRHGNRAVEIAPENPEVQLISLVLDYRQAAIDENDAARQAATQDILAAIEDNPEDKMLREVLVDSFVRDREFRNALVHLDALTEQNPEEERFWTQRLQVLIQLGDEEGTEAQLVDLVDRFPDDVQHKSMLVRYYMSQNRIDDTETFLRSLVAESPSDNPTARIDLIRFLTEMRGLDAANLELDRAIDAVDDPIPFIVLKASLDFSSGNSEVAIKTLEDILETAEPGEETNAVRVTLARMFLTTGNEVGARALVETVLADDAGNPGALKMNARWMIDADNPNGAIAALRTALDTDPEDAEALTLMAEAYARTGSSDLSRDFLSLAVEASNNAPAETIRYVRLMIDQERYLPAEDVLLAAIRLAPQNPDLLQMAAELYLAMDDLPRVEQVVQTLQRIGTPEATQIAVSVEAERLNRSAGTEEAMQYLAEVASAADASLGSQVMLIRAQLANGNLESALGLAETLLSENPDSPPAKLVLAATAASVGDLARAEEMYRSVLDLSAQQSGIWLQLSQIKFRQGDPDGGRALIAEGLAANPDSPQLLWASASMMERDGDFEGAIAIYEQLYANDTNSIVVANNLASMLTTYRDDPESLDRAWNIARRFRDVDIPAIQDTYGWIAHRRGDSEEALSYLESAAAGLPNDALTQFHFAEALFAVGRNEDALEQYRRVLQIAGATDTRPQIDTARARLAEIEAAAETE